jgi:serine/threonine protein phosphatase 1
MKYFVCSDIHGAWNEFNAALVNCQYDEHNTNHQIIVVGDMFGRAATCNEDIINIYKYLTSDIHANKPIVIHGNHEQILEAIFKRGYCTNTDIYNGEDKTIAAFADTIRYEGRTQFGVYRALKNYPEIEEWLKSLPYYYETEHYIFAHGSLPIWWENPDDADEDIADWRKATKLDWFTAEWEETDDWLSKVYHYNWKDKLLGNKTFVFGHWGTFLLRKADIIGEPRGENGDFDIWISNDNSFIGLDSTVVWSHQVNMLVINEGSDNELTMQLHPWHTHIETRSATAQMEMEG